MKQLVFIIYMVCVAIFAQGQEFGFLNYSEDEPTIKKQQSFRHNLLNEIEAPALKTKRTNFVKPNGTLKKDKLFKAIDFSVTMGGQVGVAEKDIYYANSFISPSARIKLTDKLSVHTGIGYSHGLMSDNFLYNLEQNPSGAMKNVNTVFAYASAIYSLTPKTSILASGIVKHQMFSLSNENVANTYSNVALGLNYKVTSNFSINAQINYGNTPNYSTTFSPSGINFLPSAGF